MKRKIILLLSLLFSMFVFASDSDSDTEDFDNPKLKLFFQLGAATLENIRAGVHAHENEDRWSAASIDNSFTRAKRSAAAFVLTDGHGGALISTHVAEAFIPTFIGHARALKEDIPAAIRETFLTLDDQARSSIKQGATTSVAIVFGKFLYLAHAGDSPIFVYNEIAEKLITTEDHKPSNEQEKLRIESEGGQRLYSHGCWRVGGLAVSRSIGDHPKAKGLTAEPEWQKIELNSSYKLIVLVSDGVSDVLEPNDVVNIAYTFFDECKDEQINVAQKAAQKIVDSARAHGSMDDITAVVVRLIWEKNKPAYPIGLVDPIARSNEHSTKRKLEDEADCEPKRQKIEITKQ